MSSSERAYQTTMDWARKIMQLAAPISAALLLFLIYHLVAGIVPKWGTPEAARPAAALAVIASAVSWLNIAFCVFLASLCVLFWAEEVLGLSLAVIGLSLYYGVPFLFDFIMSGQVTIWSASHNAAALAIYEEFRVLGMICAAPGALLTLKDIVLRCIDGSRTLRENQSNTQLGSATQKEEPIANAPIGISARCWQMPFCRKSIRGACPIYLARTRCWRARVGCMCEEMVIRQILEPFLRKADIGRPVERAGQPLDSDTTGEPVEVTGWERGNQYDTTVEEVTTKIDRRTARASIPNRSNLTPSEKRERCRNCVIYNEHQRLKYQFVSPIVVMAIPAIAYFYFEPLATWLGGFLSRVDVAMAKLSLDPTIREVGFASAIPQAAQYVLVGCLVLVALTMSLRFVEFCVFKLKI